MLSQTAMFFNSFFSSVSVLFIFVKIFPTQLPLMTITVVVLLKNREVANHLDLCYQSQNIKPPLPAPPVPP